MHMLKKKKYKISIQDNGDASEEVNKKCETFGITRIVTYLNFIGNIFRLF